MRAPAVFSPLTFPFVQISRPRLRHLPHCPAILQTSTRPGATALYTVLYADPPRACSSSCLVNRNLFRRTPHWGLQNSAVACALGRCIFYNVRHHCRHRPLPVRRWHAASSPHAIQRQFVRSRCLLHRARASLLCSISQFALRARPHLNGRSFPAASLVPSHHGAAHFHLRARVNVCPRSFRLSYLVFPRRTGLVPSRWESALFVLVLRTGIPRFAASWHISLCSPSLMLVALQSSPYLNLAKNKSL